MDLYPAIDLSAGRVVRLHQGDFARETVYGDDPVLVAKAYADAGAAWVHVVDLDEARRSGSNRSLVVAVAAAVSTPVQAGGGVRDLSLLDLGVSRVVLGSLALEDPDAVAALVSAAPGRVAIGLDHHGGEVRVRGWQDGSGRHLHDLLDALTMPGLASFVITDIARDGMLEGLDVEAYRDLVARTPVPVIASGGVGSLDDIRALAGTGVAGVIVGKALYEGAFSVEEALAACAP